MNEPAKRTRKPAAVQGRPLLLVRRPELVEEIITFMGSTANLTTCAQALGIGRSSILAWQAQGRTLRQTIDQLPEHEQDKALTQLTTNDRALLDFADRVTRARSETEVGLLVTMQEHARKDWRANAWLLEYVYHYRRPTQVEHVGADGGPIKIESTEAKRARARQLIDEVAAKRDQKIEAAERRAARRAAK